LDLLQVTEVPLIDTELHHKRIGFRNLKYNAVVANESWKMENLAFAMSSCYFGQVFYGCLFVHESEFDLSVYPAHLTTGSSIMPTRKPDVLN
jgi:argininosuccinate lyase